LLKAFIKKRRRNLFYIPGGLPHPPKIIMGPFAKRPQNIRGFKPSTMAGEIILLPPKGEGDIAPKSLIWEDEI